MSTGTGLIGAVADPADGRGGHADRLDEAVALGRNLHAGPV